MSTVSPGWHCHENGGGLVQNTAYADPTVYVAINALVSGSARVYGNARVCGNARVYGNAQVCGNARVYGNARVCGNVHVYDNARVCGSAQVCGNVHVYDNARVSGNAQVYGNAQVCGNAQVYGGAWRVSPLSVEGGFYMVCVSGPSTVSIGCQRKTIDEWLSSDWSELVGDWRVPPERVAALRSCVEWFKSLADAGCENVLGSEREA